MISTWYFFSSPDIFFGPTWYLASCRSCRSWTSPPQSDFRSLSSNLNQRCLESPIEQSSYLKLSKLSSTWHLCDLFLYSPPLCFLPICFVHFWAQEPWWPPWPDRWGQNTPTISQLAAEVSFFLHCARLFYPDAQKRCIVLFSTFGFWFSEKFTEKLWFSSCWKHISTCVQKYTLHLFIKSEGPSSDDLKCKSNIRSVIV